MKCAIAGGGTGGHLFPALAVGEVLQQRGHEVLIFISEKDIDTLATRDRTEFRFEKLPGVGFPRLFSPALFGFLKRFNDALSACRAIYKRFEPDAVLGMGGFTSTAPILAGRMRRVPTFVHDSNAIPGKANRLNARLTNAVLLGFEECARFFPGRRCEVTGTPIRKGLASHAPRAEARAHFGLDPSRRTLLVMGGSQGARGINEAVIRALPFLKEIPLQVIHLTGAQDEQTMTANYRREDVPVHVSAFCHRMDLAYSAADLAIARSGAASLSELAHFGLPSVLIPYPHAADNHQELNAEIFERAGAAVVLNQTEATPETLTRKIRAVFETSERLEKMSARALELAPDRAAERVADVIERYVGERAAERKIDSAASVRISAKN